MLKNDIEKLREKINHMIEAEDSISEEILEISREMDILIIEQMKKDMKALSDEQDI